MIQAVILAQKLAFLLQQNDGDTHKSMEGYPGSALSIVML